MDGAHQDDHHQDHHGHGHGHANDRGLSGMARYLRWAPRMWRSSINDAVIDLAAPTSGENAIDIGAGMGPGTVSAAKRGAAVTAVEPTPFLRHILSVRRLCQRARTRITIVDAGVESLPLADRSADVVWSVNTMHHWVDPERGAAEIARVLRPSGRVVLIDEDFEDPAHPEYERFGDGHGGDDDHHGFTMVDAEQMGELLRARGMVDVQAAKRELDDRPVIAVTASAGPS